MTHRFNRIIPAVTFKTSSFICIAAFIGATAIGFVTLGIIFHARDELLASPTAVGWLSALWSLGYIVGCIGFTPFLQKYPPQRIVILSTLCMSFLFLIMASLPTVASLMVVFTAFGLTLSLFWPYLMGWLSTGHEGEALGRELSRYNMSWCSALIISPFLCGSLSEIDTRLPIWLAGGLMFGASVLLLSTAWLTRTTEREACLSSNPSTDLETAKGHRTRLRYAAWLGLLITFFGVGVLSAVFPMSARQDHGFSKTLVGGVLLVRSLFKVFGFMVLGKTHRWHFNATGLFVGQALGIGGFVVLWFATGIAGILAAMLLCGLGAALSYSYSMFHGVSGEERRSHAMAIHETLLAGGVVLGSALGGYLYERMGMASVYGLTIIFFTAALPIQAIITVWAKRTDPQRHLDIPVSVPAPDHPCS